MYFLACCVSDQGNIKSVAFCAARRIAFRASLALFFFVRKKIHASDALHPPHQMGVDIIFCNDVAVMLLQAIPSF